MYDEEEYPPTVLIDNSIAFRIQRIPGRLVPYLSRPALPQLYPDRFQNGVDAARQDLLSGADAKQIYQDLLSLQTSPGLLCRARWTCDEYYYLLGLAAELAKNPKDAIDAYLNLWPTTPQPIHHHGAAEAGVDRGDAYTLDHQDANDHTRAHIDARDANGSLPRYADHADDHTYTHAHTLGSGRHTDSHFHTRDAIPDPINTPDTHTHDAG